jgi:hypothetical protein
MHPRCLIAVIALIFSATAADADWFPGDPHKMHFPQLPDPNGWDVNSTFPQFLADDWQCSETGPVSDVHFWFSFRQNQPVPIDRIHLSIHSDVPADPKNPFSHPGDLLWEAEFIPGDPYTKIIPYGEGDQGWYDPKSGEFVLHDHSLYFQANIENIPEPFHQELGKIYWLDVSIISPEPDRIGWKTSLDHFNDDAVWWHHIPGTPPLYHELIDPITGQSLDLAFVITPEPGSLIALGLGMLALLRRR